MSNVALRRWLLLVAALRLLSVYLGFFDFEQFRTKLFDLKPELVTDLYGRTFAIWTMLTCALCIICSRDPCNKAIYGATLLSFVVALFHFTLEVLVYETMSFSSAITPIFIAGISTLWMAAGWNYYTKYSSPEKKKE